MKPKTKFPPPGRFAAEVLAAGEVDLALSQPMEVIALASPSIQMQGLMPAELQDPPAFTFSVGVLSKAKEAQAGQALAKYLRSAEVASMLKARGMDPG
jgi:ABC-type molybdate transport system substrate-binding protein